MRQNALLTLANLGAWGRLLRDLMPVLLRARSSKFVNSSRNFLSSSVKF